VTLTWTHVETTGASPITDFSVQYAVNSGAWAQFTHTASTIDSITVTGLTNGTAYSFRVAAITLASAGTYSTTATATPLGLAFTPVFGLPTSTATGFTVNITNWNPAFVWGNAQVTRGTATVSVGTGANGILPVTVSGMSPGASA
jgi:titin